MNPLFVLDTETTGLQGIAEGDKIVEIGICRVDLDRGKVYPEYERVIHTDLTPSQRESWVFQHTDLSPEDVDSSPWREEWVAKELFSSYCDGIFTAYNTEFDFGQYLRYDPWRFRPNLAPCIMKECANRYDPDGRWFSAQAAYNLLCPDNPTGLEGGKEEHRALSDAVFEGHILLRLLEKNEEIKERFIEVLEMKI